MKLGLISASYPPHLDGIGDYTWWMANTLAATHDVSVFTRSEVAAEGDNTVKVTPFMDAAAPATFSSLAERTEGWSPDGRGWLVLQYNPFGYGNRGYCPWVPLTLAKIRRQPSAPRVAVMFHETYVPAEGLRFRIMRMWQRRQVKALAKVMDMGFASTERWAKQVNTFTTKSRCNVLPVGSNLPRSTMSHQQARKALGFGDDVLIVGLFGSHHISRRLDWIAKAVLAMSQHRELVIVYAGKDGQAFQRDLSSAQARFVDLGALSASGAADAIIAMDVMLSPFSDGASTRRGSMLAGLQQGVAVVANRGPSTDGALIQQAGTVMQLSAADDCDDFVKQACAMVLDDEARQRMGDAAARFFDERFAWSSIADQMVTTLESHTR